MGTWVTGLTNIKEFPLPALNSETKNLYEQIAEIVEQLVKTNGKLEILKYERQIDGLVYELYGLTPEEINIIEKSLL